MNDQIPNNLFNDIVEFYLIFSINKKSRAISISFCNSMDLYSSTILNNSLKDIKYGKWLKVF